MSAENLIAQHRYAEALDLLEAMAPPDRDCDVEYHRGVCLAGLARYEEALRAFDVAEDMGAEPYWLKWNRGAALHQIGRTEEAVQELVSAAFDHPLTEGARLYAAQVIAGVETKPKWIAPAMAALLRRVTARETPASAQRAELMAGGWQENRAYEASVQDALRDVIRPGDIVFDVGANIGGLAVPAARAVGPTGLVVAFEASPRNLPVLNGAIISSGLRNLWVVDRAVYARSGEMV
ncbi:MAG TPA: protein arginine N-methyltransferase, partial [Caulobacteraceae bacterium]